MKDCKAIRLPHKENSQFHEILGSCNWQTIFAAYIWSTYRMMEPNEGFLPEKKGWSNNSAIFSAADWLQSCDELQSFRPERINIQGQVLGCPWKLVTIVSKLGYVTYFRDVSNLPL